MVNLDANVIIPKINKMVTEQKLPVNEAIEKLAAEYNVGVPNMRGFYYRNSHLLGKKIRPLPSAHEVYEKVIETRNSLKSTFEEAQRLVAEELGVSFPTIRDYYYKHKKELESKTPSVTKDSTHDCPKCHCVLTWIPNDNLKRCDKCGFTLPMTFNFINNKSKTLIPEKIPETAAEEPIKQTQSPAPSTQKGDVLKVLTELIAISQNTNIDLEAVFAGLLPVFRLATTSIENSFAKDEVEKLQAELATLSGQVEELANQNEELKKKLKESESLLAENQSHMRVVNKTLDEFLKLESLRKISQLEDFTANLKVLVDSKSGFVMTTQQ